MPCRTLRRKRQATIREETVAVEEDISAESEVEDGTYVHTYGRPWVPGAQLTDATIAEMMVEDTRRIVACAWPVRSSLLTYKPSRSARPSRGVVAAAVEAMNDDSAARRPGGQRLLQL